MIAFIVGTSAELIKIAPVHRELSGRGVRPQIWYTGMHMRSAAGMLAELNLPEPDVWLAHGAHGDDVARPADVPVWAARVLTTAWRRRRELRAALTGDGLTPVVLVHGDTFSTVLGALIGRMLRVTVGHVEAGLRSGSLRSPFPEEGNRRLVAKLAHVHFAPSPVEVGNLAGTSGRVVDTGANTVVDALRTALATPAAVPLDLPAGYGLVTLHRFELVRDEVRHAEIFRAVGAASAQHPMVMLLGSSEKERLAGSGLLAELPATVTVIDKLPYAQFAALVAASAFVVTDSGGLQEECAYLGLPCLVHRERTERPIGLGENVVLSGWQLDPVRAFLADPQAYRRPSTVDRYHPSAVVADTLTSLGACPPADA